MASRDQVTTYPVRLVTVTEDKVTQIDIIFLHGVRVTQDKITQTDQHNERTLSRGHRNEAKGRS